MAKKLPFNVRVLKAEERRKWLLALTREASARGLNVRLKTQKKKSQADLPWTTDSEGYFTRADGVLYRPSEKYISWVKNPSRFLAAFGGRGAGKTVLGIQKALDKIRSGYSGIVVAPDFEHFRNSTWLELRQWIPWHKVHPDSQYKRLPTWTPKQSFTIPFVNGAYMICKGLKDPDSARGPNVNWFWYDEGGRDPGGDGWKLGIAGVRVGNHPQAWLTTTPNGKAHWTYKTFVDRRKLPETTLKLLQELGTDLTSLFYWDRFSIHDNKANLDPLYYASMVESYGTDWFAQQELEGQFVDPGARMTQRSWLENNIIEAWQLPEEPTYAIRFWDLAASEKKTVKDDPDYTVGTLLVWHRGRYIIAHQVQIQESWLDVKDAIIETAHMDGFDVSIRVEQEPGASGKSIIEELVTLEELAGYDVAGIKSSKDKIVRANPWISKAKLGVFYMVRGAWNHMLLDQFEGFPSLAIKDDTVDSISGAYKALQERVPVYELPSPSTDSPFGSFLVPRSAIPLLPLRESDRAKNRFVMHSNDRKRW